MEMIRVTSSFADGPVNFNPTGPVEDQTQKLILSTAVREKGSNPPQGYPVRAAAHYVQQDRILWRSQRKTFLHTSHHHQPIPKLCEVNKPRPV